MKPGHCAALGAVALLLSACIPSVYPFFTDKDVVFDARLVGEWQSKEDSDEPETWTFERSEGKTYKLTVREKKGKQGKFAARLFQLKNEHFLDLIPTECELDPGQADLVGASIFPGQLIMRVPQLGPELKLAYCDYEWLEKHLEAKPKSLAHHKEDKRILLTARTRELQRFVLQHLGEGERFQKPEELVRKKN